MHFLWPNKRIWTVERAGAPVLNRIDEGIALRHILKVATAAIIEVSW